MDNQPELGIIDDVQTSTMAYIRNRWGWKFYLPGVILIVLSILGAYYWESEEIAFVPLVWFLGGYGYAHSKILDEFMRQFAEANGFYYSKKVLLDMQGALFNKGHSRFASNLVEGRYQRRKMRFFHYQFSIGKGKRKRTYQYTVCELALSGIAPNILVESRSFFDFNSFRKPHQKEMPLESNFRDHFTTYVPEHFDIETFEIFTPDVIATLIDLAKGYDFEFIENRLYIFRQNIISKRQELSSLLRLAQYLTTVLEPRILRLQDDIAAMDATIKV